MKLLPRPVIAALVSVLSACGAHVPLPRAEPLAREVHYPAQFQTFPSGLRAVIYETPGAPRMTVTVSYGVGFGDDPEGQEGMAHLAEHLSFRSRPQGPQGTQLKSQLLALGAAFNAYTRGDTTDYVAMVPAAALEPLLALERERLEEPLANVSEEVFLRERDVVVAELRQKREHYREVQQIDWLHQVALAGHPYARRETAESLGRISLDDVRAFFRRHYRPENAIVVVSGPRDAGAVLSAVQDGLRPFIVAEPTRAPDTTSLPSFPLDRVRGRREVRHADVELPRVWVAWPVPGASANKNIQLEVIADKVRLAVLGSLFDDDRVHDSTAFSLVFEGVALVVATAEVADAKFIDVISEKLKDAGGIAREELSHRPEDGKDRLSPALRVEAYAQVEALSGHDVATWVRTTGKGDYLDGLQRQIVDVLDRPLDGYIWQYLDRTRASTLVVLPESATTTNVSASSSAFHADEFGDSEDLLSLGEQDVRRVVRAPGFAQQRQWTLPNGLHVVVVPQGSVPVVDVRLVVRAAPPPPDPKELARGALAFQSSRWSFTDRHTKLIGAAPIARFDDDHLVVGARAANGNLLHVLDDVARWVREQPLNSEPFYALQKLTLRTTERASTRLEHVARAAFLGALYPSHAYGVYASEQGVEDLSVADVRAWMRDSVRPDNATLLIVGDVTATPELERAIAALFEGWSGAGKPVVLTPPPAPADAVVRIVDRPGAKQAWLRVGYRVDLNAPIERASAEALVWLLERRLDRSLRDAAGVTYGAMIDYVRRPAAGAFTIDTSVDLPAAAATLRQLRDELARAAKPGGLTGAEAERARWQLARGFELRFGSTYATAERLEEATLLGRSPAYWDEMASALPEITTATLTDVAARLDPSRAAVVIVGDAAALRPGLESAGYRVEVITVPKALSR